MRCECYPQYEEIIIVVIFLGPNSRRIDLILASRLRVSFVQHILNIQRFGLYDDNIIQRDSQESWRIAIGLHCLVDL